MSLDPIRVDDTRTWFGKARNDIRAAQVLIAEQLFDEAGFHCQQAVEKSLKGFLLWHSVPIKRTHDLNMLSLEVQSLDAGLATTLAKAAPLTQFAVDYRYPGSPISCSQLEAAGYVQIAEEIFVAISSKLPFPIVP